MFGKVVKHELRANAVLYLVCFTIALLFCVATVVNGKMVVYEAFASGWVMSTWVFLITMCGMSIAVLGLMYAINTAIRYDHSMYGREGYLTFTLPISSTKLVLGKMTTAMIWGIGVFVVCILLCFSMLYSAINPDVEIMSTWEFIKSVFSEQDIIINIILFLVFCLIGILELIATIYLSICIAYLPVFRKGNRIIALVVFFGIHFVENKILEWAALAMQEPLSLEFVERMSDAPDALYLADQLFFHFRTLFIFGIVLGVVFIAIYTGLTIYLTKKYTALQ